MLCTRDDLVADLLEEVRRLSLERSVVRGQIVTLTGSGYESTTEGLTFVERPTLTAADVILPEGTLGRVEDQVVGIAAHSAALRALGQHLKRGVLLYGPPGTGKTHTVRYLLSTTPRHTVVLLAGDTLRFVGFAAHLARALQPAIVVLEDCDLVAEDRGMHGGPKPLLFEVLDAMDGLAADADVTFLLTTNRVDALERALAQRPGRVDLAVEIPLPDEAGRVRLLELYAPAGRVLDRGHRRRRRADRGDDRVVRQGIGPARRRRRHPGGGHRRGRSPAVGRRRAHVRRRTALPAPARQRPSDAGRRGPWGLARRVRPVLRHRLTSPPFRRHSVVALGPVSVDSPARCRAP